MELHEWAFPLGAFREMHDEQGGDVNASSAVVEERWANIGATISGRNMFEPVHGPWPHESWRGAVSMCEAQRMMRVARH